MQGLAIVGIIVLAAGAYLLLTALMAVLQKDGEGQLICAWLSGGILFVLVVVLWATTPCPFFVGGGT